jgi:secondary thiamine-phosphate synthase enzyme
MTPPSSATAPTLVAPACVAPARATSAGEDVTGPLTVRTHYLSFPTQGEGDVVNLTDEVNALLRQSGLGAGTVTVFAPGATGAVTTLEFEPGAVRDFQRLFDQIVPRDQPYRHNLLLSDGNGHSHVRAGLLGPSVTIPFVQGRLALGTWQEVVFVCFDDRPRDRRAVVQLMGVDKA